MAKLSELKVSALATCTTTYNGQTLMLTYRPETITQAWLDNLEVLQRQLLSPNVTITVEAAMRKVAEIVCQLVTDWDVTDDDNAPVPFTPDAVAELPIPLIMKLITGPVDDIKAKNQSGVPTPASSNGRKGSRGTSSQPGRSRKISPTH